jgi:hypothetical protein
MNRAALAVALLCGATSASAVDPVIRYPYRVEGVCPFECCQYGQWTARSDIPVVAAERAHTAPAFTIRAGETFEAVGGAWWTTAPYVLKPNVPVELTLASNFRPQGNDRARLGSEWTNDAHVSVPAGTEIHVVADLGEGAQVGLAGGKAVMIDESAADPGSDYSVAKPRAAKANEWWIEVKSAGRHGWFERGEQEISGSDACE